MSSFNIGPINEPLIQSSQGLGKDGGGGGNTGFMNMRNKKKKKQNENEDETLIFPEDDKDTFEKEGAQAPRQSKIMKSFAKFINKMPSKYKVKKDKDTFVKSEPKAQEKQGNAFSKYNVKLGSLPDSIEDSEYEIANEDDYYHHTESVPDNTTEDDEIIFYEED